MNYVTTLKGIFMVVKSLRMLMNGMAILGNNFNLKILIFQIFHIKTELILGFLRAIQHQSYVE